MDSEHNLKGGDLGAPCQRKDRGPTVLKTLTIRNLTVFPRAELECARHLNVIVGENGSGKTHLLKAAYTLLAVSADEGRKTTSDPTPKSVLQTRIADKLVGVFRPERLSNLVHRKRKQAECGAEFGDPRLDMEFAFGPNSKPQVEILKMPTAWSSDTPVYFPTRELLTIYPNFVSLYEGRYVEFEESWRDTSVLTPEHLRTGEPTKRTDS